MENIDLEDICLQKKLCMILLCETMSEEIYWIIIFSMLIYNKARSCFKIMYQKGNTEYQGLSQGLKTGCPKLSIVKYLGIPFYKGDHNTFILQP